MVRCFPCFVFVQSPRMNRGMDTVMKSKLKSVTIRGHFQVKHEVSANVDCEYIDTFYNFD